MHSLLRVTCIDLWGCDRESYEYDKGFLALILSLLMDDKKNFGTSHKISLLTEKASQQSGKEGMFFEI